MRKRNIENKFVLNEEEVHWSIVVNHKKNNQLIMYKWFYIFISLWIYHKNSVLLLYICIIPCYKVYEGNVKICTIYFINYQWIIFARDRN